MAKKKCEGCSVNTDGVYAVVGYPKCPLAVTIEDLGPITIEGPIEISNGCTNPIGSTVCNPEDIYGPIVTAIGNVKDYEYKTSPALCIDGTWQYQCDIFIDGVLDSTTTIDTGVSCDEPLPVDPQIEKVSYCDVDGTDTKHIKVCMYTFPDPTDLTNVVETVLSDTDTGEPCNECVKKPILLKQKFHYAGLENTSLRYNYFYDIEVTMSDGSTRPCTLPAASGRGPQMVAWADALRACFPEACEVERHRADWKPTQLPQSGAGAIPQTDMLGDNEIGVFVGQYIQFTYCPGDAIPVAATVVATDHPKRLGFDLIMDTAESDIKHITHCISCDCPEEEFPKCAIPVGDEFPELPAPLCYTEVVPACDDLNFVVDPENPVAAPEFPEFFIGFQFCTGVALPAVSYFTIDANGDAEEYILIGTPVDCETGLPILEPVAPCTGDKIIQICGTDITKTGTLTGYQWCSEGNATMANTGVAFEAEDVEDDFSITDPAYPNMPWHPNSPDNVLSLTSPILRECDYATGANADQVVIEGYITVPAGIPTLSIRLNGGGLTRESLFMGDSPETATEVADGRQFSTDFVDSKPYDLSTATENCSGERFVYIRAYMNDYRGFGMIQMLFDVGNGRQGYVGAGLGLSETAVEERYTRTVQFDCLEDIVLKDCEEFCDGCCEQEPIEFAEEFVSECVCSTAILNTGRGGINDPRNGPFTLGDITGATWTELVTNANAAGISIELSRDAQIQDAGVVTICGSDATELAYDSSLFEGGVTVALTQTSEKSLNVGFTKCALNDLANAIGGGCVDCSPRVETDTVCNSEEQVIDKITISAGFPIIRKVITNFEQVGCDCVETTSRTTYFNFEDPIQEFTVEPSFEGVCDSSVDTVERCDRNGNPLQVVTIVVNTPDGGVVQTTYADAGGDPIPQPLLPLSICNPQVNIVKGCIDGRTGVLSLQSDIVGKPAYDVSWFQFDDTGALELVGQRVFNCDCAVKKECVIEQTEYCYDVSGFEFACSSSTITINTEVTDLCGEDGPLIIPSEGDLCTVGGVRSHTGPERCRNLYTEPTSDPAGYASELLNFGSFGDENVNPLATTTNTANFYMAVKGTFPSLEGTTQPTITLTSTWEVGSGISVHAYDCGTGNDLPLVGGTPTSYAPDAACAPGTQGPNASRGSVNNGLTQNTVFDTSGVSDLGNVVFWSIVLNPPGDAMLDVMVEGLQPGGSCNVTDVNTLTDILEQTTGTPWTVNGNIICTTTNDVLGPLTCGATSVAPIATDTSIDIEVPMVGLDPCTIAEIAGGETYLAIDSTCDAEGNTITPIVVIKGGVIQAPMYVDAMGNAITGEIEEGECGCPCSDDCACTDTACNAFYMDLSENVSGNTITGWTVEFDLGACGGVQTASLGTTADVVVIDNDYKYLMNVVDAINGLGIDGFTASPSAETYNGNHKYFELTYPTCNPFTIKVGNGNDRTEITFDGTKATLVEYDDQGNVDGSFYAGEGIKSCA